MEPGALVWAKMKRYSPWPGMVVSNPSAELLKKAPRQKNSKCIFFFGAKNYAWIEAVNIKPYLEFKDTLSKSSKLAAFKEALLRIEEYVADPIKYKSNAEMDQAVVTENRDVDAEFDKLRENDTAEEAETDAADADDTVSVASVRAAKSTPSSAVKPTPPSRKATPAEKKRNSLPLKFKVNAKKAREASENNGETPSSKRKRPMLKEEEGEEHGSQNSYNLQQLDYQPSPRRNLAVAEKLISRTTYPVRLETDEIDMTEISNELRERKVTASSLRFGFLGLGIMGSGIVKNLINTGHKVVVWNRSFDLCNKFVKAGAEAVATPADVIDQVDITFSCVSDPIAAKEMVFGNCGVLSSETLSDRKGYVEMTGIDDSTSQDISEAIVSKGGRYLEAQLQGSKKEAQDGTLIVLAAGDNSLFEECTSCFDAISANAFHLGDVGSASKMYLVMQLISGGSQAVLAEGLALANKSGLDPDTTMEVLKFTKLNSSVMVTKGNAMIANNYETHHPLMHLQKDLKLALNMSESYEQPMPMTAAANEVFKSAKRAGYSEHDSSALYVKSLM